MKILHIINSLGPGGAENLINNLLPLMIESGNDVDLLILTKDNSIYYEQLSQKINIIISPYKKIRDIRNIKFIASVIKSNKYDIVHAHLFPVLYFVALAKRKVKNKDIKFIYTEHSTSNGRRKFGFNKIENYIYSKYDRIIAISDGVKNQLSRWLNKKNSDKIVTIYNGIDTEKFKNAIPYDKKDIVKNYEDGDILLLSVGRFSKEKDQPTVIKTLKELDDKYHLVLVGDGPRKQEYMDLVSQLNLLDRVHFLGIRNDVDRITKTADICIVSSNWEGFGLVVVEGMAAGKPVIGNDVVGLKEILSNEKFIFKTRDVKDLIEKINLASNKNYENSQDYTMYNLQNMTKNLLDIYLKIKKTNIFT